MEELRSPVKQMSKQGHLAIVLVHTVRNVQDPIHLHIVGVKRLLILQKHHTIRDQRLW